MKFNVFWPLLVSLAVGIAALGYFTAKDLFAPQRAVWDAITITDIDPPTQNQNRS